LNARENYDNLINQVLPLGAEADPASLEYSPTIGFITELGESAGAMLTGIKVGRSMPGKYGIPLGNAGVLPTISAQAGLSEYMTLRSQGATYEEAAFRGALTATSEFITEKIPMEHILKAPITSMFNFAYAGLSEFAEEGVQAY